MSGTGPVSPGTRVEISWQEAREANRRNWDDRAAVHEQAYDLGDFDDPDHLSVVVADDLPVLTAHTGGLQGRSLLHLQCHIGTDTVSLARRGARVTGLDLSGESLAVARRLAERTGTPATWVRADVLDARAAVTGEFDVVYTSIGTICWLADLGRWARQVAALLRPGGVFYLRDGHPMMYALDEDADGLVLRHPYLTTGAASVWDSETSYTGQGRLEHTRTYEWPHPLSEVVGSLLAAGLVLERLDEGRHLPWRFSPRMVQEGPHRFVWPGGEADVVPCTFTVVARRPA